MTNFYTYSGLYTPELLRAHPDIAFVFGDNSQRVGKGGQAIVRDEPNALGIATKRSPGEFMQDTVSDAREMLSDVGYVEVHSKVVIPVSPDGRINIGTGLAELPYRAPLQFAFLEKWFASLKTQEFIP